MKMNNMPLADLSASPLVRGAIDRIEGDLLYGWLFSAIADTRPILLVNGEPAKLVDGAAPRPDVCAVFGMAENVQPGFLFKLTPAPAGAHVCLCGATPDRVFKIAESALKYPVIESNLLLQLERAAKIAREPNAVGIVCWDGAHNPIGRAKTLYDIAATRRPAVLICYLHREFGGTIWPPLLNWDGNIVAIPWDRRCAGHKLLARYGVNFETVWICKPRPPSFQLAAAVARKGTRFILDIDDDEDAFLSADNLVPACYDAPGANLAHFLRDGVAARTVSGPQLQGKFGGQIVRHARPPKALANKAGSETRNIVFCGTARPHKNVAAMARAVNILAAGENMPLRFHVYGDVQPAAYRQELADAGAILHGFTPLAAIDEIMEQADVIVSGFFCGRVGQAITDFQVPAKISDALVCGKPVLTPQAAATADMARIPGVYIFDETNFLGQLLAALRHGEKINPPEDFTPAGAYRAFESAENEARQQPDIWLTPDLREEPEALRQTLVLIWKQHDAGLYGRRVDQLARSCKSKYPDHKVIILEFVGKAEEAWLAEDEDIRNLPEDNLPPCEDFLDESCAIAELLAQKKRGLVKEGINYRAIAWSCAEDLRRELSLLLEREKILTNNSLFVIFPVIELLEAVADLLRPYKKIVDVVDNELGWAKDGARRARLLEQYFSVMAGASQVVFNNSATRDFFAARGFAAKDAASVIPNWYCLPPGVKVERLRLPKDKIDILYSGNMNDRIDWQLLQAIAGLPNVRLHLAGTAKRSADHLRALMAQGAIYHGVLPEKKTLALLSRMDAAIVAHLETELSKYMHPIKIGMYQACGVPVIAPGWLKAQNNDVIAYESYQECINIIKMALYKDNQRQKTGGTGMNAYMNLIEASRDVRT